jgi:hypothetical protein
MKHNLGTADRIIRLIIAALVTFLFLNNTISGTTGIVLMVIAIVFLITSLINFCPIYAVLGWSTQKS